MPHAADAMSYGLGFVVATGLLHLCGIAAGALARWPAGTVLVRGAGGLIAVAGGAVLGGMI
jgi:urease accessory protein